MKSKKLIGIIAIILLLATCFTSCNTGDAGNTDVTTTLADDVTTTPDNDVQTTTASNGQAGTPDADCAHEYTETVIEPALALKDGKKLIKCDKCGDEKTETIPMTKRLKLLAIGNSFTVDPTYNLWGICHDAGIEELVIATFHIGSCTYKMHWNNFRYNLPNYVYYKATSTTTTSTSNVAPETVFEDEDWDVFVYHQSGLRARTNDNLTTFEETLEYLDDIYYYLKGRFPNALHFYQMAWAYQDDCTQAEFVKYYGGSQKVNYDAVISSTKDIIVPMGIFDGIIPVAGAIQNLRTSYFGDTVTRDGYHLNYGYGRWTASLCWYATVTGGSIEDISWYMPKYPDIATHMPVLKESVRNALEKPYEVVKSQYTQTP